MENYIIKPVPYYFSITSNTLDIGNYKYGNLKNALKYNLIERVEQNKFSIKLIKSNIIKKEYPNELSFYSIKGSFNKNLIYESRDFVFFKAMIEVKNLFSRETVISFNSIYNIWAISRFSKKKTIGELLTDITTIKLLNNDILSFHGGAIELNGKAYIITGLPDVGKTYTILSLLENQKYKYMAEDILLIEGNRAISVPLTQTVEKRREKGFFESLKCKVYEFFIKNNCIKTDIIEYFKISKERIAYKAEIDSIFFLTRGNTDKVEEVKNNKERLLNLFIKLNHLEFTYFRNELLLSYLFFNENFNITYFMEKEKELLRELVENSKIYIIYAPSPKNYPKIINSLISSS